MKTHGGEGALVKRAASELVGNTPLVALRGAPNVFLKCEHLNPSGSVKDRTAKAILDDAEARGAIAPGATLVEATAGNTGLGLALVGRPRGYRVVCVMPEKMAEAKRIQLRAAGAEVVVTANAPLASPENFRNVAARLADERGWFLTDQFANPANPRVHETTTAVEILEALSGRVGAFVAGAGTGGTITGVARALRREAKGARVVLADPVGSQLAAWIETGVPTGDGPYAVEGIGAGTPSAIMDRTLIDAAERVSDEESFDTTRRLIQEHGLYVGGSAGTAVAAALRVAARGEVDGPIVAVLPDSWDRYTSTAWMRAFGAPS